MTTCESSVAAWIQNQLTIAGTPPVERVYQTIRIAYLRACETDDKTQLATTTILKREAGTSDTQTKVHIRELEADGRIQAFRNGNQRYFVPTDMVDAKTRGPAPRKSSKK